LVVCSLFNDSVGQLAVDSCGGAWLADNGDGRACRRYRPVDRSDSRTGRKNISFDATGKTSFYNNSYFEWSAYTDPSATMAFYVNDVLLFSFSLTPETIADFSPVTFGNRFHVNAKDMILLALCEIWPY